MGKSVKNSSTEKTIALIKAKANARKEKKLKKKVKVNLKSKSVEKGNVAKMKQGKQKQNYSKEELQYFKKIILDKKKEILEELEALKDNMMDTTTGVYDNENSTYSTHMEQGTDAMEREKTFLFASREGKFLNYLEDALVRIEKGTYGKCIGCGKLIEKERLEAVPHAQQCLQCKLRSSK